MASPKGPISSPFAPRDFYAATGSALWAGPPRTAPRDFDHLCPLPPAASPIQRNPFYAGAPTNHGTERCISFGSWRVDHAVEGEVLRVISPGAIEAARAGATAVTEGRDEARRALDLEPGMCACIRRRTQSRRAAYSSREKGGGRAPARIATGHPRVRSDRQPEAEEPLHQEDEPADDDDLAPFGFQVADSPLWRSPRARPADLRSTTVSVNPC